MTSFRLITLILFSIISLNLMAKEEILSTTDNDDNDEVYTLVVNVDNNSQTLKELFKDTYIGGKKIRREALDSINLKTKEGVILEKRGDYNVLNLKSDNFDNDRGGKIIIDTLYNGFTGERKFVELDLAKSKNGWKLFKNEETVSKFHVKVNKVIILGTVGIKTIIME